MKITAKGQVTVPQEIRERFGLLPDTEVEFAVTGGRVYLRKAAGKARRGARGMHARAWHPVPEHRRDHGADAGRMITASRYRIYFPKLALIAPDTT